MPASRERVHAARVIASRRLYETLISPGYYLALSIGLALAALLVTRFAASIDTSGFDYHRDALYDLLCRGLEGAFGAAFVQRLFAEGPLVAAVHVGMAPLVFYLALGTIVRLTVERAVGAMELVVCGPADGASYLAASFLKDIALAATGLIALLLFLLLAAAANNLHVGPMLLRSLAVLPALLAAGFGYAVLLSVLTDNTAASVALFLATLGLFLLLLAGRFMIVEGYARNLANTMAWILQWISPLYYWGLALRSANSSEFGLFALAILLQLGLTAGLLAAASRILAARGVRP